MLWARSFLLLQSAADLYGAYSVRITDGLYRLAFELSLQVDAIRFPWDRLNKLHVRSGGKIAVSDGRFDTAWKEVTDRLRAYAAWALTNDLVYHRSRSSEWELRAIHQPTNPQDIPKTPEEAALLKYLYGDWEVIGEAEAQADLKRARAEHAERAAEILGWLSDPAFGGWTTERLAPWIQGLRSDVPPFFQLLDPEATTISRAFRSLDIPHLYGAYSRGSMTLHGSSLTQFLAVSADSSGKVITPLVLADETNGALLCSRLAETAHSSMLGLMGMRDHCLQDR